uniref:Uncharacterized protein n=1 Tax=Panagrolaimus davidi TaxID=227884 RepID=A0A914PG40_9BILA
MNAVKYKVWLTKKYYAWDFIDPVILSPKIYRNDVKRFFFFDMIILFEDLIKLSWNSKLESLILLSVTVKDKNGKIVTVEKICEAYSTISFLNYRCCESNAASITQKTAQKLLEIFSSSRETVGINLDNLPEQFEFEVIFDYIMRKRPIIAFSLSFDDNLSVPYKERMVVGVNKILASKKTIFPFQSISYRQWGDSALEPLYLGTRRYIVYTWKIIKYRGRIKKNKF